MNKLIKFLLIILGLGVIFFVYYLYFYEPKNQGAILPLPAKSTTTTDNEQAEMTFVIAGDAMFGRAVYAKFHDDLNETFGNFDKTVFQGKDLAFLNLEGPIVQNEFWPDTNPNNLIMKFPPQTKDVLTWLGINSVGLANNHTLNQGTVALEFTREILEQAGIMIVGDPQNSSHTIKTFSKNHQQISIFAVNILANTPDLEGSIKEQEKNSTFVIIFPHWGSEYQNRHSAEQERLAHLWIDAGADLIVGSHPHVIQDAEIYKNRPIFYSLGNFIFDQTFSKNTQEGLIVTGIIANKKLSLTLWPASCNFHPRFLEGADKWTIINDLKKDLGFDASSENQGDETIEFKLK